MHPGLNSFDVATEDELLALQREFIEKKLPPSAKVKRINKSSISNPSSDEVSIETPLEALERLSILEDVKELGSLLSNNHPQPPKKKSLFARRKEAERGVDGDRPLDISEMIKSSTEALYLAESTETPSSESTQGNGFSTQLLGEIDNETDRVLANMSLKEISDAREQLLKTLDPNFVRIITKGQKLPRSRSPSPPPRESAEGSTQDKTFDGILEVYKADGLSRLALEAEKLQWMRDDVPAPATKSATRFNFEGIPLRGNLDIPAYQGLHHHGLDPEKPGYTLEELFMLARSTVPGQRVMAMNLLGKIFQNLRDELLSAEDYISIRRHFAASDGVLLFRMNLDVNWHTVVMATLHAMHSWLVGPSLYLGHSIVPNAEERSLSFLSCLFNGHKAVSNAVMCDSRLSDAEAGEDVASPLYHTKLAAYDSLSGFVSMGVFSRFRHIFGLVQLPHVYHTYMIDILLRIARHSIWACSELCKSPELFAAIQRRYFQVEWPPVEQAEFTGASAPLPSPVAIRFLVAVCQAGLQFARQLLASNIFGSLDRFLAVQAESLPLDLQPLGIQLQAEVLQLGRVFAFYNLSGPVLEQMPSLLTLAPPPSPALAFFYRWKESLALSAFVLPHSAIQQRWLSLKPSFSAACQLLLAGRLARDPQRSSAALDFAIACVTLQQAELVQDTVPVDFSDPDQLGDLIDSVAAQAIEALNSLSALRPTRSAVWSSDFRRFLPAIAPPRQMNLLEELAEFMPRVGLLRSLMEMRRVAKHGVSASNYGAIFTLLSQLLGSIGCLEQQCWSLLLPIFDLALGWLHFEAPPAFQDYRCAVAVWYIGASFDKGAKLEASVLRQVGLALPRDYSFVGTYYASSNPVGLLDDYVSVCTYDDRVFWGLHNLDLADPQNLIAALKLTTRVYSLFASATTPQSIFQAISQRLNPRADIFAVMEIFSAPLTTFFDPEVIHHLLPLLEAVRDTENRLTCSHVLMPLEDDRVVARRFEIYKDAIHKYLNCGFFHSGFLPIFLHPLDMTHFPWDFRAVFWGELVDGISLYTKQQIFATFVAAPKAFLYPVESSFVVLDIMASALCSRSITQEGCPILYEIASHHLKHALKSAKTGRLAQLRVRLELLLRFDL